MKPLVNSFIYSWFCCGFYQVKPAGSELERVVKELKESVIESTMKAPVREIAAFNGQALIQETQEVSVIEGFWFLKKYYRNCLLLHCTFSVHIESVIFLFWFQLKNSSLHLVLQKGFCKDWAGSKAAGNGSGDQPSCGLVQDFGSKIGIFRIQYLKFELWILCKVSSKFILKCA